MANRYWVASSAGSWNDTANWSTSSGGSSGASVPGSSDAVYFDGNGLGNCTLNRNESCASLTTGSGYTGTLGLGSSSYTFSIGGNASFYRLDAGNASITVSGNCTFNYTNWTPGSAAWSVAGNFDCYNRYPNSSASWSLTLTGSSKKFEGRYVGALTIASGATISCSRESNVREITIAGTYDCNGKALYFGNLTVSSGGTLKNGTGTASLSVSATPANYTIDIQGTINNSSSMVFNAGDRNYQGTVTIKTASSVLFPPCTFGSTSSTGLDRPTIVFDDDIVINGNLTLRLIDGILKIDNSSKNPNIEIRGDVAVSQSGGTLTWTKGTGTITFSGSADQSVDFNDLTVEDIVINKSAGTVTFTDGFTTDSFTLTAGTIAFGATPDTITTTGNWTIGTAGQVDPTELDGWTWSVGGNLSLSGESGDRLNLAATAAWYLQVTGTATASYVNAAYSDASGYTEIDADDGTNTDGGHNTNWAFGAAFSGSPWYAYAQM